jgi:DNA invertase Pin-like site-specific DNA recombinase
MMFQVLGSFAEYERDMIRARVKAGIARAKAQGKHCGRSSIKPELRSASVTHWRSLIALASASLPSSLKSPRRPCRQWASRKED